MKSSLSLTALGLAAVLATAHDIVATIAFIKLLDLEISLTVIAAILTVIGYSLNDTIIIFDRVRENLKKHKGMPLYDLVNLSVNETLPRSVLTHATTLAATLAVMELEKAWLRRKDRARSDTPGRPCRPRR